MKQTYHFAVYDDDGEILQVGESSFPGYTSGVHNTLHIAEPVNQDEWYVDTVAGQLAQKTGMGLTIDKLGIVANNVDVCVIGNIPAGSMAYVKQGSLQPDILLVNDGELEISSDTQGEIKVTISHFMHLPTEFVINAT